MIGYVQGNDIAHLHSQLGVWVDDLAAETSMAGLRPQALPYRA